MLKREGQIKGLFNAKDYEIDLEGGISTIGKLDNLFEVIIEKSQVLQLRQTTGRLE